MDRMQILLTADQRRRLGSAAEQRGEPVAVLIREAIDAAFPAPVSDEERTAALELLLQPRNPGMSPDQLDELLVDRFDLPV
ncbi:MAG: antitoxin [Sporichthyaceae bacterium]